MYAENMLRLESGAIGEIVGSYMLPALVDRLIELDVSLLSHCQISGQSKAGTFDH
jgi:RNA polymerase I-specific transcription initiation factor RRN3